MPSRNGIARIVALAAALFVATGLVVGPAGASAPAGKKPVALAHLTVKTKGVAVKKSGTNKFVLAKKGAKTNLKAGDTVRTNGNGTAEVKYFDGSLTRLDVGTTFVITRLSNKKGVRHIESRVNAGKTWNRVKKLSGSETFAQEGNGATAAVQGTGFAWTCVPSPDPLASPACVLTLVDGAVSFGTTQLSEGQEALVGSGGQVAPPEYVSSDEIAANPWVYGNLIIDYDENLAGNTNKAGPPSANDLARSRLAGPWDVTLTTTASSGYRNLSVGAVRKNVYTVNAACSEIGFCALSLTRATPNGTRTVPLRYLGNGRYRMEDVNYATQDCQVLNSDGSVTVARVGGLSLSTVVEFSPSTAVVENGIWKATAIQGTVQETATAAPGAESECLSGAATSTLAGTPASS